MPCRPLSVSLEVDPSATEKIIFGLDKTCDANDQATWTLNFELQEGNPLATVVKLDVEIDPENHPAAEATANDPSGLDANQRAAAKVAAATAKDPTATEDDKKEAAQDVIAARAMPATV
jgi:hypothetical protein